MKTLIDRINVVNEILNSSDDYSISKDLEALDAYKPIYPHKPSKPLLTKKHTSEEALSYATALVEYEKDMEEFRKLEIFYINEHHDYHEMIKDLIIKKADLRNVPSQYIGKLWDIAYEEKSSYGYHEVYYLLLTLKSIFDVTH